MRAGYPYIYDIMGWPVADDDYQQRQDEAQVPTIVDPDTGDWGYSVSPDSNPIRWCKLLLLREGDLENDIRRSEQLRASRARLAESKLFKDTGLVGLIAHFLRGIWGHALEEIEREESLLGVRLKVAITIPAMWPDYAKEQMNAAVRVAGILNPQPIGAASITLSWVREPEAAALCTLREQLKQVEIGESFIVCDCGGGTVDIITYTVESIHPLQFKEAVEGAGKLCGAFLIDQAFENHIMSGQKFKFRKCSTEEFRRFTHRVWEHGLKRNFNAIREPSRRSWASTSERRHDFFTLEPLPASQWFSDSYTGIRFLIGDQQRRLRRLGIKPAKNIFLVGGLGSSRYLHTMLHNQFMNILQVKRTWSAVARGATMAVLEGMTVNSRVSRQSYGIQIWMKAARAKPAFSFLEDDISWDSDGTARVSRMLWYFKEGERSDPSRKPVSHRLYMDVDDGEDLTDLTFHVYTCSSETPPCRMDSSVQPVYRLRCALPAGVGDWRTATDDENHTFQRLDKICLTMKFGGSEPTWALRVGNVAVSEHLEVEYVGSTMEKDFEGRCRVGLL
ncbi:hypothetical protein B0T21DRAFT_293504 [Apiosordaria backusii]|uniref:Uncharacterized protein n=1 Tax=Apiosordaria backusii TaxID=314023 RepID=A0AA40E3G0_9PEZI|nr:hypothetical protein B0T21DRAFT_293504 [Apiosordaria backusii]